jgi:hypothetical protein
MIYRFACIVEGHGEVEALPILLRRLIVRIDPTAQAEVSPPIRVPRDRLLKPDELERAVELASRKVGSGGALLLLLDSEDDCPAQLGPTLLRRSIAARSDLPIAVVLPKHEFEAWFLAAATSLAGNRGLPSDLQPPPSPETVRGAKEWLSRQMPLGRRYVETLDQPALASKFDLELARSAPSFDKCWREVSRLMAMLGG